MLEPPKVGRLVQLLPQWRSLAVYPSRNQGDMVHANDIADALLCRAVPSPAEIESLRSGALAALAGQARERQRGLASRSSYCLILRPAETMDRSTLREPDLEEPE